MKRAALWALLAVLGITAGRAAESDRASPTGSGVVRSAFTSGVVEREPVDSILTLGTDESHVYYFTELRGLAGQRIVHRWEYEGEIMAEVPFEVGGWRWRVWSRKALLPRWTGEWTVSVLDGDGRELARDRLRYNPAVALRPSGGTSAPLEGAAPR